MRRGRGKRASAPGDRRRTRRSPEPPIPLTAVDLLAGLAPGVELHADDVPPGIDPDGELAAAQVATMTVADAGKLLRCGEATIRRLIREAVLRPVPGVDGSRVRRADVEALQRAGVLPRSAKRPGE
jgi:hypothetical protein